MTFWLHTSFFMAKHFLLHEAVASINFTYCKGIIHLARSQNFPKN